MVRRAIYFSGRVQGVGFRYDTARIAIGYEVSGFVENLSDGRVHVVVEGACQQVDAFICHLCDHMSQYIYQRQVQHHPATGEFGGSGSHVFAIRR